MLPTRGSLRGPGISLKGFASVEGVVKDLVPHPGPLALVVLAPAGNILSPWVSGSKYWALQVDRYRTAESILTSVNLAADVVVLKMTVDKHPASPKSI